MFEGHVFQEYRLQVYDRCGELVFESVTPTEGWDGMPNGLPLPSDVYLFFLDYHFTGGRSGREQGEMLLR